MKKIGNVNGAILANLMDEQNNVIGTTLDTPNAIAYAMAVNPNVTHSVAHYELFGDTIRTRQELQDRFKGAMLDQKVHLKNLTWFNNY